MERILTLLTTLLMLLIPGEREESEIKIHLQDKEDILIEEQVQETIIASGETIEETIEETIDEIQTLAESEVTEEAEESDALAH
ncbi:MAG: hypothetical protein IJA34_02580, partial [Lachnospiraceae bacterium]|nr:hypothetical protein [Lachnospiraceae bacterium]